MRFVTFGWTPKALQPLNLIKDYYSRLKKYIYHVFFRYQNYPKTRYTVTLNNQQFKRILKKTNV